MKRLLVLCAVATISFGLRAQNLQETIRIPYEQVPAVVKQSFENEFRGDKAGTWTARVIKETKQGRVVANPVWYNYTQGKRKKKIELRFSPNGEMTSSRGLPVGGSGSVSESGQKD